MLLVHNTGNKRTTAFYMYQHTTVVVFTYGMGLVLSCQIQDDLSLYYNMVAANGKMDPKCKESNANRQRNQCKIHGEYSSTPATGEGLITQSL